MSFYEDAEAFIVRIKSRIRDKIEKRSILKEEVADTFEEVIPLIVTAAEDVLSQVAIIRGEIVEYIDAKSGAVETNLDTYITANDSRVAGIEGSLVQFNEDLAHNDQDILDLQLDYTNQQEDIEDLQTRVASLESEPSEPVVAPGTIADIQVGGVKVGDDLSGLTHNELTQKIFAVTYYPTRSAPSITVTLSAVGTLEYNSKIQLLININFNRGAITQTSPAGGSVPNAGAATNFRFFNGADAQLASQAGSSFTVVDYLVQRGVQSFKGNVTYAAGPQPLDSKGQPYQSPLVAGTLATVLASFTGSDKIFYGAIPEGATINSATVRALASVFENASPTIPSFSTGISSSRMGIFIRRASTFTLASALDITSNSPLTPQYKAAILTVSVNDGNGVAQTYDGYVYTQSGPYTEPHTHQLVRTT